MDTSNKRLSKTIFNIVDEQQDVLDKDLILARNLKLNQTQILALTCPTPKFSMYGSESLIGHLIRTKNSKYFKYIFDLIDIVKYKESQSKHMAYMTYEFACQNKFSELCINMIKAEYLYNSNYLLYAFQIACKNNLVEVANLIIEVYSKYHSKYDGYLVRGICISKNEDVIKRFVTFEDNFECVVLEPCLELLLLNAIDNNFDSIIQYIFDNIPKDFEIESKYYSGEFLFKLLNFDEDYFNKYWTHVTADKNIEFTYKGVCDFLKLLCINEYETHINYVFSTVKINESDRLELYNNHSNCYIKKVLYPKN